MYDILELLIREMSSISNELIRDIDKNGIRSISTDTIKKESSRLNSILKLIDNANELLK